MHCQPTIAAAHFPYRLSSLWVLAALCSSAIAQTSPLTAYLERAETQASGGQIRSYAVPTTDSAGVVSYWDVTVDLSVSTTGKPNNNATVTSVKQAKVRTNRLVPGKYGDSSGGSCNVYATTLSSGRQEASVTCTNGAAQWNFTVDNGDIAGHPYELQLLAAGIDKIPGYLQYNWGIIGATTWPYGGCFGYYSNDVVAARQVGPQIVVTSYRHGNVAVCSATLTQTP